MYKSLLPTFFNPRRFYSSPAKCCHGAFLYLQKYKAIMPEELRLFLMDNEMLARQIDEIASTQLSRAKNLDALRSIYCSTKLNQMIRSKIKPLTSEGLDEKSIANLIRIVTKWNARYCMIKLKEEKTLQVIHQDNLLKYGNPIGPTLSYLEEKYDGDPSKMIAATSRFREASSIQKLRTNGTDTPTDESLLINTIN